MKKVTNDEWHRVPRKVMIYVYLDLNDEEQYTCKKCGTRIYQSRSRYTDYDKSYGLCSSCAFITKENDNEKSN